MQVEDRLAGAGTDIEDGTVSVLEVALAGDLGGCQMAAADDVGVGGGSLFQSGEVALGNDEHVRRRLGVDVFEGEDVVILVNLLSGDFVAQDAAEEAVGIGHEFTFCGNDSTCGRELSAGQLLLYRYFVTRSAKGWESTFHVPSKGLSRSVRTKWAKNNSMVVSAMAMTPSAALWKG